MIVARKKKHNSQIYNLFTNEDNPIVSVNLKLEDLKIAFFDLVDKTREKFGEKGPVTEQRRLYPNIYDLSYLPIFLYRQIFGTYII